MKTLLLSFLLFFTLAPSSDTVITRFKTPDGYKRAIAAPGTFAEYLQNLPLKPAGTHTKTYQGKIAATDAYTAAVADISVGNQDLQQCADAVMRLKGEFLYHQKNYAAIAFKFTDGSNCDFVRYANGYRYQNGRWILKAAKDYSYPNFMRYMNLVFMYAGTLSLDKELKKVESSADLSIGDVFIRGGSPGHCFIVMDMAENVAQKKVFLLAQSYMHAQNIQILKSTSAWFSLDNPATIPYGELIDMKYLKRFY